MNWWSGSSEGGGEKEEGGEKASEHDGGEGEVAGSSEEGEDMVERKYLCKYWMPSEQDGSGLAHCKTPNLEEWDLDLTSRGTPP